MRDGDDRVVNTLKKSTGICHKFTPIEILFPGCYKRCRVGFYNI